MGEPYNDRSDCWALGCLLYELMSLKRPFHVPHASDQMPLLDGNLQGNNLHAVVLKICHGEAAPLPESWAGTELSDLVDSMLRVRWLCYVHQLLSVGCRKSLVKGRR